MKQLTIGIIESTSGLRHFSPSQIAAAARRIGIGDDRAAELVGELLRASYAAEAQRIDGLEALRNRERV